jgi:hypothetical protein
MLARNQASRRLEPQTNRRIAQSFMAFVSLFALFAAVTMILFWQWVPHLHSALLGPPEDNMQDFWNTWYASVARKPHRFFFTDMIRFPEGTSLYYQSFSYPKVFAVARCYPSSPAQSCRRCSSYKI